MLRVGVFRIWLAAGAIAAFSLAAEPAQPLEHCGTDGGSWSVGPKIVPAPSLKKRLAAQANVGFCSSDHDNSKAFPLSYAFHVDAQYQWVQDSVELPDATRVTVSGGGSLSLAKPPRRAPPDLPPDQLPTFKGGGWSLGFVDVGVRGEYLASADRSEHQVAAGIEGRYALNAAGYGRLAPSVVLSYDWVRPLSSEAREAQGLPEQDVHRRWNLRAYWNTNLSFLSCRLTPLRVQADVSVFRAKGLAQAAAKAGWESGEYAMASIHYHLRRTPIGLYASYSTGKLPTSATSNDALSVGVAFSR